MRRDGIDKGCQYDRVPNIGPESTTLRDTATDNGGRGPGKDELEEPQYIVITIDQKVVRIPNEFGITGPIRKGKADGVVTKGRDTHVHQVFSAAIYREREQERMNDVMFVE